jgi:hypothetical protein
MENEKSLDFNPGENQTPAGAGQPGNNNSASDSSNEDLDKEIDETLTKNKDDDNIDLGDDDDDDTVVLPKKKVKELLTARDNYKKGLLAVKEKLKAKKPAAPAAKNQEANASGQSDDVKAIMKGIADEAITEACKDPFVNENWSGIIAEFDKATPRTSKTAIIRGILKATAAFKQLNPSVVEEYNKKHEDDEDNNASADLSRSNGLGKSSSGAGQKPVKKSILPKRTPVTEWFGKNKN